MHHAHIKSLSQSMCQISLQMWSNNACEYYEHVCKCIVAYLLNHTHQSKFNWLINASWDIKSLSQSMSQIWLQMWSNNACEYYEHVCKCIVAYLLNHTHQSKFNWLINAPWAYKITISINVSDMVANVIKQCVWILRTCLQMHNRIPLKSHPLEQI